MPDKEFKAGVHDVMVDGQPITLQPQDRFEAAIRAAAQLDDDSRWQQWTDKPRRMESHRAQGPLHLMNFVTAEFAGPGKTGQSAPVSPIGLRDDEYFAHETAALYDQERGIILLESGLFGMGPGAIKTYFRQFDRNCIISLCRHLDPEATAKARSFQVFRELHLQVSMGEVSELERRLGTGVIQSLGKDYRAQVIDIVIKCSRSKGATLEEGRMKGIIEAVINSRGDEIYEKCKVKGRAEEDEHLELIDLIAEPLKSERRLRVDPVTRKVFHVDKWDALIDIHAEFTQE